jgi:hypothetical protein
MKLRCIAADFGNGMKIERRRRIEREAMERSQNLCDVRDEIHPSSGTTENLRGDLQQRIQTRAGKTEVSVGQSQSLCRLQRDLSGRSTSKNLQQRVQCYMARQEEAKISTKELRGLWH